MPPPFSFSAVANPGYTVSFCRAAPAGCPRLNGFVFWTGCVAGDWVRFARGPRLEVPPLSGFVFLAGPDLGCGGKVGSFCEGGPARWGGGGLGSFCRGRECGPQGYSIVKGRPGSKRNRE